MKPEEFVAEVYLRMADRYGGEASPLGWEEVSKRISVRQLAESIAPFLPADKEMPILEIGFGEGEFLAACAILGYRNITGADFSATRKNWIQTWQDGQIQLLDIYPSITEFLGSTSEQYAFIYLSHVIEHIPKYSLLETVDAIYQSLKEDGCFLLKTPNMEAPCALSSYYVTLGHEYGFSASNLKSLLELCQFDDVKFIKGHFKATTAKQRLGQVVRRLMMAWARFEHRFFGVGSDAQFDNELVTIAYRRKRQPLFRKQRRNNLVSA